MTYHVCGLCNQIDLKTLPERMGLTLVLASDLPDDTI